ncbi:hypothetical protein [Rhizobium leguminosarum]|uniref:hypothetical protein n=1 Tax=Rhizobium leguminosarum TaxID=384 RepID=UPI00143F3986|nr:hypothetical protein [Rhizobium leguminosarum]NKL23384.1 hypothetical protein [Rhizobium leguminosarum bv. viciae]
MKKLAQANNVDSSFLNQNPDRLGSGDGLALLARLQQSARQGPTMPLDGVPARSFFPVFKNFLSCLVSSNPRVHQLSPHIQRDIGLCDVSCNRRGRIWCDDHPIMDILDRMGGHPRF